MRRHVLSALVAAAAFFTAVADMPLAPGLTETPGVSTVFDKPEGRIVQLVASGRVDRDAVLRFYGETLPQLGWRDAGGGNWRREDEQLRIEVRPKGRESELRISIAPSRAQR